MPGSTRRALSGRGILLGVGVTALTRLGFAEPELPAAAPIAPPGPASSAAPSPTPAASEAVRVSYSARPGCPDQDAYFARVTARVPSAHAAAPGELARQVTVTVAEDEVGYLARLDFVDVHGEAITRTLTGATCDEVVSGIALVTALALEAQLERETTPSGPAITPPPEPRPKPKPSPPSPPSPPPANPAPTPPRQAVAPRWRFAVGLGAGSPMHAAPGTPLGIDVLLRVGRSDSSASGRVAVTHWRLTIEVDQRSASFRGWGGSAEACPLAWPAAGLLSLEPCAAVTLGALEGHGRESATLPSPGQSTIFWADARAVGRLRVAPTRLFELEGEGFLAFPLRRHAFVFERPKATVFEIPTVGTGFRVGLLLHFP